MKHLKIVLLLTFILLICIFTSWFVFKKHYLNDMLHTGIEKRIAEQIENEFHFTFDNFRLNLLTSGVQLNGIHLYLLNQADTVGYFKGDLLVDVKGWWNLLFNTQKQIKNIVLLKAELYYAEDQPLVLKSKEENNGPELVIANASAKGKLLFAKQHKVQNGQLSTEFDITAAPNYNSTEEIQVDNLIKYITNFQLSQIHYYLPDGFYQLKIDEVAFNEFDDIALKQVVINPVYSKKAFAKKKKLATDYINVSIDSIQLLSFDSRLNENIFIDQVLIFQPNIDVYKDKNYPDNQAFKAVLVDLLKELKTPVHVRSAEINNMFIKYAELANDAEEAGELFFSEGKATILNITNVQDSIKLSGNMLIDAEAKFYGKGKLNASINYALLSESGQFSVNGSLSPMAITEVNAIMSKILPVNIKSGQMDKLYFSYSGTSLQSAGEMWFEYSDLDLDIMELKYWNNNFTRKLLSSIGNRMMRSSNPTANGTFRVGAIKQDRDTTRSMFNYWWISLKSGFLSTLGATAEKEVINYKSGQTATFRDKIGLGDK